MWFLLQAYKTKPINWLKPQPHASEQQIERLKEVNFLENITKSLQFGIKIHLKTIILWHIIRKREQ